MENKINKITDRNLLCSAFVFLLGLILLLAFWNQAAFASDEVEIFVKGQAIAKGQLLYKEVGSQHMPLMYYIAAFFSLIGADTMFEFRLCFYIIIALLWALMYYRYNNIAGKMAMLAYPVIYIMVIATIPFGPVILSEHLQGIGFAILILELIRIQYNKKLYIGNNIMIALAILLSFGSAFVAIFTIFAVGLTVLITEFKHCYVEKLNIGKTFIYLIKKYFTLIVLTAAPFVILIIYYIATDSFRAFYGWAYKINRAVYPKYLGGGYGSGILSSMFSGIKYFAQELSIGPDITINTIQHVALLLMAILGLLILHKKYKKAIFTCGMIFILITSATRGVFVFHGVPCVAILCVLATITLPVIFKKLTNNSEKNLIRQGIAILCAVALCSSYLTIFTDIFKISSENINAPLSETDTAYVIDLLTEDGEGVGMSTYDYTTMLKAKVLPASVTGGSCPWLWEWGSAQAMTELTSNPPKVFFLDHTYATWGYKMVDYASDLINFVRENYSALVTIGQNAVYVRNDIYDESIELLRPERILSGERETPEVALLSDGSYEQDFNIEENCTVSAMEFMVGTYGRTNECTLEIDLYDETSGKQYDLDTIDCSTLTDNSCVTVSFDEIDLLKDHSYSIKFTSPDATESDNITIYRSYSGASDEDFATINGVETDYRLGIIINAE